jgi:hypothetical protein
VHLGHRALGDLGEQVPEAAEHGHEHAVAGRMSETIAASMPAREVPSISSVASFAVAHTRRYSSCVSVIVAVMNGSYCPTSSADIARSTLGYAEIGPGP